MWKHCVTFAIHEPFEIRVLIWFLHANVRFHTIKDKNNSPIHDVTADKAGNIFAIISHDVLGKDLLISSHFDWLANLT